MKRRVLEDAKEYFLCGHGLAPILNNARDRKYLVKKNREKYLSTDEMIMRSFDFLREVLLIRYRGLSIEDIEKIRDYLWVECNFCLILAYVYDDFRVGPVKFNTFD